MLEMEKEELVLDEETCIEIALKVYEIYEEQMKPPLFAFYTFPDWLIMRKKLLTTE